MFFGDHLANNGTETNEFLFRLHNNLLLEHCGILVYWLGLSRYLLYMIIHYTISENMSAFD